MRKAAPPKRRSEEEGSAPPEKEGRNQHHPRGVRSRAAPPNRWRGNSRSTTVEPPQHRGYRTIDHQLEPGHIEPWQTEAFSRHYTFLRHKIEDAHDTNRRESQGRHNHSAQVRKVAQEDIRFLLGAGVLEISAIMHVEC